MAQVRTIWQEQINPSTAHHVLAATMALVQLAAVPVSPLVHKQPMGGAASVPSHSTGPVPLPLPAWPTPLLLTSGTCTAATGRHRRQSTGAAT